MNRTEDVRIFRSHSKSHKIGRCLLRLTQKGTAIRDSSLESSFQWLHYALETVSTEPTQVLPVMLRAPARSS